MKNGQKYKEYTPEFKEGAIKLVLEQGLTQAKTAE